MKTAPQYLADHPHLIVSCLYLDFDIYRPTKVALDLFLPRMPKGAVLCFDELNDEAFPGETIAVMEKLELKSLRIRRFEFEPRISYAVIGDQRVEAQLPGFASLSVPAPRSAAICARPELSPLFAASPPSG